MAGKRLGRQRSEFPWGRSNFSESRVNWDLSSLCERDSSRSAVGVQLKRPPSGALHIRWACLCPARHLAPTQKEQSITWH